MDHEGLPVVTENSADKVIGYAQDNIRSFLDGWRRGQNQHLQLKKVIEQVISTDYEGRTVIELLQNGHDAHPEDSKLGSISFVLDETEGDYGTLYVANAGTPISNNDFRSMCEVAISTKLPSGGIGNKGVGFKSVLQISEHPEVFSRSTPDSPCFDGYCFRFATHEDIDWLAEGIDCDAYDLPHLIRENVSSLQLPAPLSAVPPSIGTFASTDHVTVIRLPIRSLDALSKTRSQLTGLKSGQLPVHLFLERIKTIEVTVRAPQGTDAFSLTRAVDPIAQIDGAVLLQVSLESSDTYLVASLELSELAFQQAIAEGIRENQLDEAWSRWSGPPKVSVAVPVDRPFLNGRLYTFLPMGINALAPLPALVNAPFSPKLDRRNIDEGNPVNEFLLRGVAQMCAQLLVAASEGRLDIYPESVADLACWDSGHIQLLQEALKDQGHSVASLPFLPELGRPGLTLSLEEACSWLPDHSVFRPEAVASAGPFRFLDHNRLDERAEAVESLSLRATGRSLKPSPEILGRFAEVVALRLPQPADPGQWAIFYDELAASVPDGAFCEGLQLLVAEDGAVVPAASGTQTAVFLPAATSESDAADSPHCVRRRFRYLLRGVSNATERSRRPGILWLIRNQFVREYRTEQILRLVAESVNDQELDHEERLEALFYAFNVWKSSRRETATETTERLGFQLPCHGGWFPASHVALSSGWRRDTHDIDRKLDSFIALAAHLSPDLQHLGNCRLLTRADLGFPEQEAGAFADFVGALGAKSGLIPCLLPKKNLMLKGWEVNHPEVVAGAIRNGITLSPETVTTWMSYAEARRRGAASYTNPTYEPMDDIAYLPGQDQWMEFADEARRLYADLVVDGLDWWPKTSLWITFDRHTDKKACQWPSPILAFIACVPWVPQSTPGTRDLITWQVLNCSWILQDTETPPFLPAVPLKLARRLTEKVLHILSEAGLRTWDSPASAEARLKFIPEEVNHQNRAGNRSWLLHLRKAYEAAWQERLASSRSSQMEPPEQVLVEQSSRKLGIDPCASSEPIYINDSKAGMIAHLLHQSSASVLAIKHPQINEQVADWYEAAGCQNFRHASEAAVTMVCEGTKAEDLPSSPLVTLGTWLPLAVVATIEYLSNEIAARSLPVLAGLLELVRSARYSTAPALTTSIDGMLIASDPFASSFVVSREHIVIVATAADTEWQLRQKASSAIAELAGVPALAGALRLVLVDLEARCGSRAPTRDDLAAVLHLDGETFESFAKDLDQNKSLDRNLRVLLASADPDLANDGSSLIEDFLNQKDGGLRDHLHAQGYDLDKIIELSNEFELHVSLAELGIPLQQANINLRIAGLQPITNPGKHHQQLEAFITQQHEAILRKLRDSYAARHRPGEPIAEYVQSIAFAGLSVDHMWADKHWEVPDEVLASHVADWISQVGGQNPLGDPLELGVFELRKRSRITIKRLVPELNVRLRAFGEKQQPKLGTYSIDEANLSEEMEHQGLLDFSPIGYRDIVSWLTRSDQWPEGVPPSHRFEDLDITAEDVDRAKREAKSDYDHDRRRLSELQYANQSYTAESEQINLMVDRVLADIPSQLSAEHPTLTVLAPDNAPRTAATLSTATTTSGGGLRVSPEKLSAIGLLGEAIAAEWIQTTFGLAPEVTWKSKNRNERLGGHAGNDGLGYDFEVKLPNQTLFIEVKSTTGTNFEFEIGESEVRRASSLAKGESYEILFITEVLNPEKIKLRRLPNPFSPQGTSHYRHLGKSLRLGFRADERTPSQQ